MASTYCNPLAIQGIGDPFVLRASDGRYYLYATSDPHGFLCWASDNLVDWEPQGPCYTAGAADWGERDFWAPECYEIGGRFYLFYSAQNKDNPTNEDENYCLGVAVSDRPTGPFLDVTPGQPLLRLDYPIIDVDLLRDDQGHVLQDEDGHFTLYFSRCCYKHQVGPYEESHIYAIRLCPDMQHVVGQPVLLLQPDQEWENWSAATTGRRWTEGPLVLLHEGRYYMMYSSNFYQEKYYGIGLAVADSPMGPFRKDPANPIMKHDYPRVSGPGHNSVAWSPDGREMFVVYHIHTAVAGGFNRQVCLDRMEFTADGKLICHGPTTTPQPMPSGT